MLRLAEIEETLTAYAKGFDAADLTGTEAFNGMRRASRIKNIASTTVGQARDEIATGRRLEDQPSLADAARSGEVSAQQLNTISDAAAADPTAEKALLGKVRAGASLGEIRDAANKIKADADTDREARRRKIHDERHLRSWTDGQGAGNLHLRDNPEVIARLMARIDDETEVIFGERRRAGQHERREAYAADALVRIVMGEAAPAKSSAKAKVIFRVDWAAWLRSWPHTGEVMELIGFGPVAASAIDEALEAGGFVAAVMTHGEVLSGVAHLGRTTHGQAAVGSRVAVSHVRGGGLQRSGSTAARSPYRLVEELHHHARLAGPALCLPPRAQDHQGLDARRGHRQANVRAAG